MIATLDTVAKKKESLPESAELRPLTLLDHWSAKRRSRACL